MPITTPGSRGQAEAGDVERAGRRDASGSAARPGRTATGSRWPGAGRWTASACRWRSASRPAPRSSSRSVAVEATGAEQLGQRRRSAGAPSASASASRRSQSRRRQIRAAGGRTRASVGIERVVHDRAPADDRVVALARIGRVQVGRPARAAPSALVRIARSVSCSRFEPRSQAITLSQASESTAVHGSRRVVQALQAEQAVLQRQVAAELRPVR